MVDYDSTSKKRTVQPDRGTVRIQGKNSAQMMICISHASGSRNCHRSYVKLQPNPRRFSAIDNPGSLLHYIHIGRKPRWLLPVAPYLAIPDLKFTHLPSFTPCYVKPCFDNCLILANSKMMQEAYALGRLGQLLVRTYIAELGVF